MPQKTPATFSRKKHFNWPCEILLSKYKVIEVLLHMYAVSDACLWTLYTVLLKQIQMDTHWPWPSAGRGHPCEWLVPWPRNLEGKWRSVCCGPKALVMTFGSETRLLQIILSRNVPQVQCTYIIAIRVTFAFPGYISIQITRALNAAASFGKHTAQRCTWFHAVPFMRLQMLEAFSGDVWTSLVQHCGLTK